MPQTNTNQPSFRDRPINIDDKGKRKWIYAKQPKGKWYKRRSLVAYTILTFLVVAPFLKIDGQPFMLLDIVGRRFYIFGNLIWTQDTNVLAIVMAVTVVSIVLFTVVFGRFWCGWACPQTIFLEMVYRRIEYLFDGNYRKGVKKDKSPSKSPVKTVAKHATFLFVTIFFTNVFLMWFIGPDGILELATSPIRENLKSFLIMTGVSVFYYWIYAFFREQVCTMVCPYGRMQSVLVDSRTISVIYDYKRGEPRGAKSKGDCINCNQCLSVCPTGIDIKNGSQLECINCTACIDECNLVMQKINKPRNLIRFDSVQGIEAGKHSFINGRTIAYSGVLLALFAFLIITVSTRSVLDTSVLRVPGSLYQVQSQTTISNMYNTKIINKTNFDKQLEVKLIAPVGEVQVAGKDVYIKKQEHFEGVLIVRIDKKNLKGKSTAIEIGFFESNILLSTEKVNFLGPN